MQDIRLRKCVEDIIMDHSLSRRQSRRLRRSHITVSESAALGNLLPSMTIRGLRTNERARVMTTVRRAIVQLVVRFQMMLSSECFLACHANVWSWSVLNLVCDHQSCI